MGWMIMTIQFEECVYQSASWGECCMTVLSCGEDEHLTLCLPLRRSGDDDSADTWGQSGIRSTTDS